MNQELMNPEFTIILSLGQLVNSKDSNSIDIFSKTLAEQIEGPEKVVGLLTKLYSSAVFTIDKAVHFISDKGVIDRLNTGKMEQDLFVEYLRKWCLGTIIEEEKLISLWNEFCTPSNDAINNIGSLLQVLEENKHIKVIIASVTNDLNYRHILNNIVEKFGERWYELVEVGQIIPSFSYLCGTTNYDTLATTALKNDTTIKVSIHRNITQFGECHPYNLQQNKEIGPFIMNLIAAIGSNRNI